MTQASSGWFHWSYPHNVNTMVFQKARWLLRGEVRNTRDFLSLFLSLVSYISRRHSEVDGGYLVKERFRLQPVGGYYLELGCIFHGPIRMWWREIIGASKTAQALGLIIGESLAVWNAPPRQVLSKYTLCNHICLGKIRPTKYMICGWLWSSSSAGAAYVLGYLP